MIESLPSTVRPEELHQICKSIKADSISTEDLIEKLPYAESDIIENIEYGRDLGFVEEASSDGIELTDRGIKLAYEDGISSEVGADFTRGIRESDVYRPLTEELAESLEYSESINQNQVLKVVRVNHDLDMSEPELKSAINSYFLTLEAANVGQYKLARGESPSRIQLREGILLSDILNDGTDVHKEARDAEKLASDEFPAFTDYDSALEQKCIPQFRLGLYQEAVSTATLILEDRVRNEGGFRDDMVGESLMGAAFSDEGPIQLGDLGPEQEGFRFLYQGTSKALRNPSHHRLLDDMDQSQARDILALINLLLTFIENRD